MRCTTWTSIPALSRPFAASSPSRPPRQKDAVVVAARLVAEDRDVEVLAAAAGEHVLDQAGARHAVADHDEPLPSAHSTCAPATCTAHTLNSGMPLVGSSAGLVR